MTYLAWHGHCPATSTSPTSAPHASTSISLSARGWPSVTTSPPGRLLRSPARRSVASTWAWLRSTPEHAFVMSRSASPRSGRRRRHPQDPEGFRRSRPVPRARHDPHAGVIRQHRSHGAGLESRRCLLSGRTHAGKVNHAQTVALYRRAPDADKDQCGCATSGIYLTRLGATVSAKVARQLLHHTDIRTPSGAVSDRAATA